MIIPLELVAAEEMIELYCGWVLERHYMSTQRLQSVLSSTYGD
jgi:hypothetical protein